MSSQSSLWAGPFIGTQPQLAPNSPLLSWLQLHRPFFSPWCTTGSFPPPGLQCAGPSAWVVFLHFYPKPTPAHPSDLSFPIFMESFLTSWKRSFCPLCTCVLLSLFFSDPVSHVCLLYWSVHSIRTGNVFLLEISQSLHVVKTQRISTDERRGGEEERKGEGRDSLKLERFKQKFWRTIFPENDWKYSCMG